MKITTRRAWLSTGLGMFLMLALAIAIPGRAQAADTIVLENDRAISGQITYEDDDRIEIATQDYGNLTFQKHRIKDIRRQFGGSTGGSFAAPAQPGAGGPPAFNPFAGAPPATTGGAPGAPAPGAQPAAAFNPFAPGAPAQAPPGGPPAQAPVGGAAFNPFAPGAPAQAPPGGPPAQAPVGFPPSPATAPSFAAASVPGIPAAIPTLPTAFDTEIAPEIPPGFDGVLYGIAEEFVVETKPSDTRDWVRARNGTPLRAGHEVRTGEGRAKLRLRGRDTLRLPPRSHMLLVALSADASQVTLELKNGSLWTEVAPRARATDFRVVTPDLTAGVRGTLFKTTVQVGEGSRVAVFKDSVEVVSQRTNESTVVAEHKAVVVNPQGQILPPVPVMPAEYDEWAEWDAWRLDFHRNVASFSMVGAPVLQGLADQIAADNAQWAQTVNEANRQIVTNRFADRLEYYANAFLKFAEDTGHVPDPETEGWQALRVNRGNWPGWNGPYISDEVSLPPADPWQRPVHYRVRYNRMGTNIHGVIYSEGLNRRDDNANPASDDIVAYAMFFRLPAIAANPAYQGPGQDGP